MTDADPDEPAGSEGAPAAEDLLAVVREVVADLHSGREAPPVRLRSSLDADLGLDSLGRAELVSRIESRFGLRMPPRALAEARTPGDLLELLGVAAPERGPQEGALEVGGGEALPPEDPRVLTDVLRWHADRNPERTWCLLEGDEGDEEEMSYGRLLAEASATGAALQALGLAKGQRVALMLPTGYDYFRAFFGALLAGGVPVPLYPPVRLDRLEDHLRRQEGILRNAGAVTMVTVPEARPLARVIQASLPDLAHVLAPADLADADEPLRPPRVEAEDLAFLQYTSGSTGQPKGVMLTHAQLLANLRAVTAGLEATAEDRFVSWLPLYHDMGLIGAGLGTLYQAVPLVLMSPLAFLSRPRRWLEAVTRHRGTLSAAPNFAFDLCVKRLRDEDLSDLDLSSWRRVINGAEPISPRTLERFQELFGPRGFRAAAMGPCYGLAENCLGVTFSPLDRAPRIDRVDRAALARDGRAEPREADDALEVVGCGTPLPGHEVRVVGPDGRELPERQEGLVQFRGPSASDGYFENPEATAALLDGPWRNTGDRGYLAEGELFLTGREKDVILHGGRNVHPHELEAEVNELPHVRKGGVAAFGTPHEASGTERLVIAVETRLEDEGERRALRDRVRALSADLLGMPADAVVLLGPGGVLKTSSGKIRRSDMRDQYLEGTLGRGRSGVVPQVLRLVRGALLPGLRGAVRRAGAWVWAAWFWITFLGLGALAWVAVLLLPGLRVRWAATRGLCRLLFRLAGIPVQVQGMHNLPRHGPCVVVANHASYVDAPLLFSIAPRTLRAVVKGELRDHPVGGRFFTRLGGLFAERFEHARALEDAGSIHDAATRGDALIFFPEGTFFRVPGLLPFHLGGFRVAASLGLDLVPVVLRGTRDLLRGDQWFPRRVPLRVEVLEPLRPDGRDLAAAARLRDAARAAILARCGEPDLQEGGPRLEQEEAASPRP